jgi:hypothetical protein
VARRIRGNGWPRRHKRASAAATSFRKVQRQAGAVLARLRKDIRVMETELARLKHDEDLWERLAERGGTGGGVARTPRAASGGGGGGGGGGRINWRKCARPVAQAVQGLQCSPDSWTQGQAPVGNLRRDYALDRSWVGQAQDSRSLRKSLARKPHHHFRIAHCRGSAGAMCRRTAVTALPRTYRSAPYARNIYLLLRD